MSDPAAKNTSLADTPYIGRFAPSPSGPLHMGSLVAAVASFLDARCNEGVWLMRMEDLDPPRESQQAAAEILHALEPLGLHWDGPVLYQSQRHEAYEQAIAFLDSNEHTFACDCSRQQIQLNGGVYPGNCRHRNLKLKHGIALRCQVSDEVIQYTDKIQGQQLQQLEKETGDFVIKRKDSLYAYQLAVVVDDAFQQINHIVRGIDLMDSTPRQLYLQKLLNLPEPAYAHIPVIVNNQNQKLSKQHRASAINTENPQDQLLVALRYLQQELDPGLCTATVEEILDWGVQHWNPDNLTGITQLSENDTENT